jgi:hypothetical protein
MITTMQIHSITTVSGFLQFVEEAKQAEESCGNSCDFVFRGQREDKPLRPKLGRLVPRGQREEIERLMFQEFKRTSVALTSLQPTNEWDYLAVAQHHGLPTRLLDWTYSALAALWFTVEREPVIEDGKQQNGVLWLLKTAVDDFIEHEQETSPFDNEKTRIYRPRVISPRIAVQRGVFTVHPMHTSERFVAFESEKGFKDRFVKFVVAASGFSHIRKHLDSFGVNRFILFPDLVGLCTHLEWRYTQLPDEVRSVGQTPNDASDSMIS